MPGMPAKPETPAAPINHAAISAALKGAVALTNADGGPDLPLARECLAAALALLGPAPAPALLEGRDGALKWHLPKVMPTGPTPKAGPAECWIASSPSDSTLAGAEDAILAHQDHRMFSRVFNDGSTVAAFDDVS